MVAPESMDSFASPMRKIAPFHGLTFFFLLGLSLLTLCLRAQIPLWRSLLIRYGVLLALLIAITAFSGRKTMGKGGALLHYFSPILFVFLIYESLGDLIQHLHPDIDPWLIRIDFSLFGVHPTVWMERWIVPWLTDIMSIAYVCYYFLPVTFIAFLYLQQRTAALDVSLFVLIFGYYISFVGYIFLPAIGPRFTLAHLQSTPLEGSFFTNLLRDTLNALEHNKRDCMPSGHTQIVLMVLYLAHRYTRLLFYLFFPIICGLLLSTVYLRYHYVVDVFAGGAVAVGCILIGPRLHRWWSRACGRPSA
jgi:membrane-associated phospholipid phosphatase